MICDLKRKYLALMFSVSKLEFFRWINSRQLCNKMTYIADAETLPYNLFLVTPQHQDEPRWLNH